MEWIAPFLTAIIVLSAVAQLLWAYALSAIAKKTDQSAIMQVLAWIPLLQMAPLLAAGDGSLLRFLVGAVALFAGNLALMGVALFLGDAFGQGIAGLGFGLTALLAVFYFGRISWNTAANRGLPGWVGLLLFIPFVNFFVYPFIAFHDGLVGPNIVGLVVGTVLILGSTAPSFQMIRMIEDGRFPTDLDGWSQPPELADLGSLDAMPGEMFADEGPTSPGEHTAPMPVEVAPDLDQSIRALLQLQSRFEALEALATPDNLRSRDRRIHALGLLQAIRSELENRRGMIDGETFEQLATHLVEIEAKLHARPGLGSPARQRSTSTHRHALPAAPDPASRDLIATRNAAPIRPFPVQPAEGCPPGTAMRSQTTEAGDEEWCQQQAADGGLRHGWYAHYDEGGRPESMGEYADGLRIGTWTRFYPNGEVRAQAQFEKGLQHGWLLSFDENGTRKKAIRFAQGVAVH